MKRILVIILIFLLSACSKETTYDVVLEKDGGTGMEMIAVVEGEVLVVSDPIKTGYDFRGWYLEETLTTKFDVESPITENLTLYARWEIPIEVQLEEFMISNNFNGIMYLNVEGVEIFTKGYGYADIPMQEEHSTDKIYHIGSVTKQFTAVAILMLEEDGLLTVEDTLDMYIADYPNGDQITIHHLLTHTSGIVDITGILDWGNSYFLSQYQSPETMIDIFKYEDLEFSPGSEFLYSNSGYILLGYIIEQVSGVSYAEFLNDNIFTPLQMTNTELWAINDERYAKGYYYIDDSGYQQITKYHHSILSAAGGLASSIEDLYKWNTALLNNTLLNETSTTKMCTPYMDLGTHHGFATYYGYGVGVIGENDIPIIDHGGEVRGFHAYNYNDLENEVIFILLANTHFEDVYSVVDNVREIINEYYKD